MKKFIITLLVFITLTGCSSDYRKIKGSDVTFGELSSTSFTCTISITANADIKWLEVKINFYDQYNNFTRSNTERAYDLISGNSYVLKIYDEEIEGLIGNCGTGVRYEIKSLDGEVTK